MVDAGKIKYSAAGENYIPQPPTNKRSTMNTKSEILWMTIREE
jgi:hypothetical protein